jgi:hypothetical protein
MLGVVLIADTVIHARAFYSQLSLHWIDLSGCVPIETSGH